MKKIKRLLRYFAMLVLLFDQSTAQVSVTCPPNMDFEDGNYGYWKFDTGQCCPIVTAPSGQLFNRHMLTNGPGIDPTGGFPIVAPGGGNYSLKLGNKISGKQAEKASYYVHIPSNVSTFSLIFRYAVVFQDPGSSHTNAQKPRFEVKAFDSATGTPIPCSQFTFVASSALPGFTCNGDTCYRPWATGSLNLSGWNGSTVVVSFASGDCANGGHFGYGYVDLTCSLFETSSVVCVNTPTMSLNAPAGFQTYTWYDSTFSTILATGQNPVIPTPATNMTYQLILAPYPGFGCKDTLTSQIVVSNPSFSVLYDTICEPNSFLGYSSTGTYIDTLVNSQGCDSVRTLHLWVKPRSFSTLNQTICAPNSFLGYSATGTYLDTFINALGCDSIRTLNLLVNPITYSSIQQTICQGENFLGYTSSGIYIDTLLNVNGCDSVRTLQLTVNPTTYSTINQSICEPGSFLGYSSDGTYVDTLIKANGCDSIRTLNLIV